MTDILTARNIKKTYSSGHRALNGVSISIKKGECVGLAGESGSGKSTLARCLLMLEKLDEGEIFLQDQPLHLMPKKEIRKIRRHMQAVFQNPAAALNPKRKIIDSLMEALDAYPHVNPVYLQDVRDNRELCANRLLEMVGIASRYLYCYPKLRLNIRKHLRDSEPLPLLLSPRIKRRPETASSYCPGD
ncbi:hypothetical protein PTHTG4_20570 [Parageobacillus thermoglucosidasius]|nr:hypothetical protein PTHTG4_20570 [Parageobacillus thermoglucosidasius]